MHERIRLQDYLFACVKIWHSFYLRSGSFSEQNKFDFICTLQISLRVITLNKCKQTHLLLRSQLVLFIEAFVKDLKPF